MTDPLQPLKDRTAAKASAESDATAADAAWRIAIKEAIGQGFKIAVIAEATGTSVSRVYQVRDGRR